MRPTHPDNSHRAHAANHANTTRNTRKRVGFMKRTSILLIALVICATVTAVFFYNRARAATTYTWNQTGTASWATSTNWSPTRTTPAADDILIFNNGATTTATNRPKTSSSPLALTLASDSLILAVPLAKW